MKNEVKAMQLKTEAERARTWRILTRGNAMQQHGIKGKQVNIILIACRTDKRSSKNKIATDAIKASS